MLKCPKCKNTVRFTELHITGYIANYEKKQRIEIKDVSHYKNIGVICTDCFDQGDVVEVGTERDLLPAFLLEKAVFHKRKKHLHLL